MVSIDLNIYDQWPCCGSDGTPRIPLQLLMAYAPAGDGKVEAFLEYQERADGILTTAVYASSPEIARQIKPWGDPDLGYWLRAECASGRLVNLLERLWQSQKLYAWFDFRPTMFNSFIVSFGPLTDQGDIWCEPGRTFCYYPETLDDPEVVTQPPQFVTEGELIALGAELGDAFVYCHDSASRVEVKHARAGGMTAMYDMGGPHREWRRKG